jgi:hypothetical protein
MITLLRRRERVKGTRQMIKDVYGKDRSNYNEWVRNRPGGVVSEQKRRVARKRPRRMAGRVFCENDRDMRGAIILKARRMTGCLHVA